MPLWPSLTSTQRPRLIPSGAHVFLCRTRRFSAPKAHALAEFGQLSCFVIGAIPKLCSNRWKSQEVSGKSRLHVLSRGLPRLRISPEIYRIFHEIFVGVPEISGRVPGAHMCGSAVIVDGGSAAFSAVGLVSVLNSSQEHKQLCIGPIATRKYPVVFGIAGNKRSQIA